MAIQPAICANCGGALKVNDTDLNGFCECPFCHTSHKVIDVITIDGLPTVKSLLMNAQMSIEDGNAERAVSTYKEVLTIKPNCHEAWWGLYLCNSFFDRYYNYEDKYGNSGPLTKASIMESTLNKYAIRAIQYAPSQQADMYKAAIQDELDYIEKVKNGTYDAKSGGKSGCYIATAVYGDYCRSEVMALRRYRDDFLAHHIWGRLFIRLYYWISPYLAKFIRPDSAIGKYIRRYLDRKVERLSL